MIQVETLPDVLRLEPLGQNRYKARHEPEGPGRGRELERSSTGCWSG